jgi:hypothetical protein
MANGDTNVFTKSPKVVSTALGLLLRNIVWNGLITRRSMEDFRLTTNDTITIPIRGRTVADTIALRATGEARKINVRDLQETSISVQLTDRVENAIGVTDEQATLDIVSFADQILSAQVIAVAEELEAKLFAIVSGAPYHASNGVTWNINEESGPKSGAYGSIIAANTRLDRVNVPRDGRVMVVSPEGRAAILLDNRLTQIAPQGLGEGALRQGFVGQLDGTPIVVSNLLTATEAYLFHKSAFVAAEGAPVVPQGAYGGAQKSFDGFAARWLMDYDADYARDRSVLTSYFGGKSVNDGPVSSPLGGGGAVATNIRAVKITLVDQAPTP